MKLWRICVIAALAVGVLTSAGMAAPKTKIGILDLQNQFFKYIRTLYDTGSVPVVKTEGWEQIRYYKQRNPQGIVDYAMVGESLDWKNDNPEDAARARWEKYLAPNLLKIKPADKALINYVEVSPNMVDPKTVEQALWWNRYAEVLCKLVGDAGFHPLIITSGVGGMPCVGEDDMKVLNVLIPSFRAAHKYGGGWAYHGYSCYYTMDSEVESYYSLRYRRIYNFFKKAAPDLMDMPLVLSEGGIDYMGDPLRDGYAYRGTREDYAKWLAWYDKELQKDPYVVGVTLFKTGGWGWESFDLEPMIPYLVNYYKTGSMKLPQPATKLGLALSSGVSSVKAKAPMLYTSPNEVKSGAVSAYKKANPGGITIVDFKAGLPDISQEKDPQAAAQARWDTLNKAISRWTSEQRASVDYIDATPGPLTIRESKFGDYFTAYMRTLTGKIIEAGFKPVVAAFNTACVPADGRDWDLLGDNFKQLWRERKEQGGVVIFNADAIVIAKDAKSIYVTKVFGYKRIYEGLLKLDPSMFGMPIVVVIDKMNLPGGTDADSVQKLKAREDWLKWFDSTVCADPDVLAAAVNPGDVSAPGVQMFLADFAKKAK